MKMRQSRSARADPISTKSLSLSSNIAKELVRWPETISTSVSFRWLASAVRVDCHGKPINSQWKLTNRREKREKGRLLFNSSFFLFVERDEAWAGALLICKQSKKRNHPGAHPSLYSVLFRSVADSSSRWFPCANIWSAPPSCSSSSLCMSIWRFNNRLNASIRQPGSAPSADF